MNSVMASQNSVLLLTRHWIRNYGSVLQSYATQRVLSEAFARVVTLDYREVDPALEDTASGYLGGTSGLVAHARGLAYRAYRSRDAKARGAVFEGFLRENLNRTSRTYRSFSELEGDSDLAGYDFFCVGSDQVWNAEYNVDNRPYFLDHAKPGALRFSFASSIGTKRFPVAHEARFVESLRSFAGLSVREVDAANYLHSFGLDVHHHVDPTLALSGDQWRAFGTPSDARDPYLLVYQLNANVEMDRAARALSRKLRIPIRRIEYWRNFRGAGARKLVRPSVEEFVGLFSGADLVLTDSFHGAAFSVNLNLPFVAFLPPKYGARITSLLQLFGLAHRSVDSAEAAVSLVSTEAMLPPLDGLLAAQRKLLRRYLQDTLAAPRD